MVAPACAGGAFVPPPAWSKTSPPSDQNWFSCQRSDGLTARFINRRDEGGEAVAAARVEHKRTGFIALDPSASLKLLAGGVFIEEARDRPGQLVYVLRLSQKGVYTCAPSIPFRIAR